MLQKTRREEVAARMSGKNVSFSDLKSELSCISDKEL